MEFEPINAQLEWEARRIVAAFGVNGWGRVGNDHFTGHVVGGRRLEARIDSAVSWYSLEFNQLGCMLYDADEQACGYHDLWVLLPDPTTDHLMMRGLYRLGFEDESVLSQLPPLSSHEKFELRLSMPREFWPQRWFDEEAL